MVYLATSQQEFSDADWRAVATGDQSKKLKLLLSGLTTGTTRVLTIPNADGTIMLTSAIGTTVQAYDADLASWAGVTRASGFDTFAATPSSANLASLLTDEIGSGNAVFGSVGTFTPSFVASGSTFSYNFQGGRYLRVENRVYLSIYIVLNTSGNTLTANALTLSGLPFTSRNSGLTSMLTVNWFQATSSYVGMSMEVAANATTATFYGNTAAAVSRLAVGVNASAALHVTNGSAMRITGFYEAAA